MIVLELRMPRPCAVRTISSHVSAGSLPFVRAQRTSSSKISAAVPGIVPRPCALRLGEELGVGHAELRGPVHDLHRAEGMDVHARGPGLHRVEQIEVERARQVGVDPALHAHLGGAELPRFLGAIGDLGEGQRVGLGIHLALGERAEPAPHVADVREVDVPVDDVGHVVADGLGTQVVGDATQRVERRPSAWNSAKRFFVGDRSMGFGGGQRGHDVAIDPLGMDRHVSTTRGWFRACRRPRRPHRRLRGGPFRRPWRR